MFELFTLAASACVAMLLQGKHL